MKNRTGKAYWVSPLRLNGRKENRYEIKDSL